MDEPVIFPHSAGEAPLDFGPFFQALPTPYLILSPALIVLAANAAYLRIAGRVESDILGLPVFDAFPGDPRDPHADGVAKLRASLQRVLVGACVDRMDVQRYDVAIGPGGSDFQPRYWKPVNMPVLHADGTLLYIIHSVEEVSGADVALKGALRDVLAALADAFRDLKAVDDIVYAAAAILGKALGASRVFYASVDQGAAGVEIVRQWCAPGVAALAGEGALRCDGFFMDDFRRGLVSAIGNVDLDPRTASVAAALRASGAAAFINVPLVEDGVPVAMLLIDDAQPR